ncbi:MAG: class I tRNA ligase family protein, partial [Candidatus Undinarchaeales archaeon]
ENLEKLESGEIPDNLGSKDKFLLAKTQQIISEVDERLEKFEHNLAVSSLYEFSSEISKYAKTVSEKEGEKMDEEKKGIVLRYALETFIQLLSPFAPHLAEELWEKLGKRQLVSGSDWPKIHEEYVDPKLKLGELLVRQTLSDIHQVIDLFGQDPEEIEIYVAPAWKRKVYKKVREGKEIKDLMKDSKLKKKGNELVKYVQNLKKRKHELKEKILTKKEELGALEGAKEMIESKFECSVNILEAEKSDNPKAKSADVLKPGIYLK